jgi:endoglucanase
MSIKSIPFLLLGLALCIFLSFSHSPKGAAQTTPLCSTCLHPQLAKGVNFFNWFMGPTIYNADHQDSFITNDQIIRMKNAGITHVRVPIYVGFLADFKVQPPELIPTKIKLLDEGISRLTSQGITVILVMVGNKNSPKEMATIETVLQSYESFWKTLAQRYQPIPVNLLYFEVMNEPAYNVVFPKDPNGPAMWARVQSRLLAAIRSVSKERYVILTSYDWDTIGSLIKVTTPVKDPNVLYTVHFYEPVPFVWQGLSSFGDPSIRQAKLLPYPAEPTKCKQALAALPPDVASSLAYYCASRYSAVTLDQKFKSLYDWSQKYKIPVYLGEFGAYRKVAPPGNTEQWVQDVRRTAEKYRIPWAYWDYKADFTPIINAQGSVDTHVTVPLGLQY